MKPIDYRNATWKEVRQSVVKSRESALALILLCLFASCGIGFMLGRFYKP